MNFKYLGRAAEIACMEKLRAKLILEGAYYNSIKKFQFPFLIPKNMKININYTFS